MKEKNQRLKNAFFILYRRAISNATIFNWPYYYTLMIKIGFLVLLVKSLLTIQSQSHIQVHENRLETYRVEYYTFLQNHVDCIADA